MIGGLRPIDILAIGAVFMLVLCVAVIGALLWMHQRAKKTSQFRQRVGVEESVAATPAGRVVQLFHDGREFEALLPGQKAKGLSIFGRMARTCVEAGITTPFPTVVLIGVSVAIVVFVGSWAFTRHVPGAGIGAAVTLYALWSFVKMKASKQAAKFDNQFVDALGLCARSLRAGHTVTSGLGLAANDSPEPVKSVFSGIVQQQELGVSLEQALRNASADHPSPDLKLFAASVAVQIRAGGNLADTTGRLSAVIRDRLRLARRVRVLIAQTEMSKKILLGLPVIVFGLLNAINPEYMKPMYDTKEGQTMLMIAAASLFAGTWLMNKMSVLKY